MSSFQPHQPAGTSTGAYMGTARSADGRNRVLQGVPSGGQFAAERHSDSVISLNLNRAPQPPAYIRIPQHVFAAVRSLVGSTVRKVRGRSMQDRPYGRPRAFSTRAKVAAAGLLVAVAAGAGIGATAFSSSARHDQQAAACQSQPAAMGATTATTASYMSVPMKGGGGGHASGHSAAHSESGHAAESSGSHVSAPVHIPTVTPTSGVPLRSDYVAAPSTNGGRLAPYLLMTHPHAAGAAHTDQCAPAPASSKA